MYRVWEEENRHLASLLDSSRALSSTLDLDDLLTLVCRKAARALQTDQCVIYEYDRRLDAIVYRAIHEETPTGNADSRVGASYQLDDYPSDRLVLNGGRVVEESIFDPALTADVRASMEEWGEKSCLSVPISFNDEPVGMLVLIENERERRFSAKEIDLARGLGEQAAVAIHHARLYRREQSQNDRLMALLETSRVLAGSLDVTKVLEELRAEAAGVFGAQHVDVDAVLLGDGRRLSASCCGSRRRRPEDGDGRSRVRAGARRAQRAGHGVRRAGSGDVTATCAAWSCRSCFSGRRGASST